MLRNNFVGLLIRINLFRVELFLNAFCKFVYV